MFKSGPRNLNPEEDLDYLIGNQRQPQLEENLSHIWNLAIHASTLHQCHPKSPIALELSQSRESLLSLVFWVSPTADCALQILDYLVPPSTTLREQYVAESIRIALYRWQHVFSRKVLEHFGYLPKFIDTVPGEATDVLVNIVLQHISALIERIGIDAIFSLALSQRHAGLLEEVLMLNDGVFPWNLRDFLHEIVRRKDAILCNTLSQFKAHIEDSLELTDVVQLTEVFNDAVVLRFHEGMRLILDNYQGRTRLDCTIPALLTFDYETVHLLKVYGCLEPNLDPLLDCFVVAEDCIDMSTRTLNGRTLVHDDAILKWYMDVQSDPETGRKLGPCHFPLYMAVFLAFDIGVISDLISAGGLLMCRKFFNEPRLYPIILHHVSTCMTVEKARKAFTGTLEYIRRLYVLSILTIAVIRSADTSRPQDTDNVLRSWHAVATLLNFTRNLIGSAKETEIPRTINLVMGDTVSAQTADFTSVNMPKSLQTQESWTMWRQQVQNVLTRGLEDQVLAFEKEEELPQSQSVNEPSYAIENAFWIGGCLHQIDDNWNILRSYSHNVEGDYGLIFDSWRLSHSAYPIA